MLSWKQNGKKQAPNARRATPASSSFGDRFGVARLLPWGLLLVVQPASAADPLKQISPQQCMLIGKKIWANECSGSVSGLTSWNSGEEFASMGIGHFIWYPSGKRGPFSESFPRLLDYLKINGVALPQWLTPATACPWQTRDEFVRDGNNARMVELRNLLSTTTSLQANFMLTRLQDAEARILERAQPEERSMVQANFSRLWNSGDKGIFALVDYVNFKGEGILQTERYKGDGWGLLQVLQHMSPTEAPLPSYVKSARQVLCRRVQNSPPQRHERKWLQGWCRRVSRYTDY